MMITDKEIVTRIAAFVEDITGLKIREVDDGVTLKWVLGFKEPLEIGFLKSKHPEVGIEDLRSTAYLHLVETLAQCMRGEHYAEWLVFQHALKVDMDLSEN